MYALEHFTARVPTDYSGLRQLATLYACEWNIPQRSWQQGFPQLPQRFEWFAIRYQGEFQVAQGGVHRFRLHSDDGARLTIDGQLVVDNDGLHTARSASGEITLAPGTHSLTLDYFQGPPVSIALQLFVTSPGRAEQIFTSRTALAAR